MEELENFFEVVIVIIAIAGSLFSTLKKAQNRRVAEAARQTAPTQPKPAAKKEPHPYASVQTMMPPMAVSDVPAQVIAPTVHTHVQPDCDTHDVPGSLGSISDEGKDPCHMEQLSMTRAFTEEPMQEGGLSFDWSGDNMVKAFVMQEVLTRPANRTLLCQRPTR